jgi:hypothetical protein
MKRTLILAAALTLAACNQSTSPPRSEDLTDVEGKDDAVAAANVDKRLAPLVAFLKDDKNLIAQLGPEGTTAENIRKRVKVVTYKEFGKAVDIASRAIAKNYQVATGSTYRRAYGIVDLLSVGDMYVSVKAGYGEDSWIDKVVKDTKRAQVRQLASAFLPEAALISADHASTTSTGNYVLVLGDITSEQAIVMTVEYEIY